MVERKIPNIFLESKFGKVQVGGYDWVRKLAIPRVQEMTDVELSETLDSIKHRIKEAMPYNVVQPLWYKGTKSEYIGELGYIKHLLKKEIHRRKFAQWLNRFRITK